MATTVSYNRPALTSLRWRWIGIAAVWMAVLLAGFGWLRQVWPDYAGRWLVIASLFLAYSLSIVWRHLAENYREEEKTLLPALGAGNSLTLVRALAIGLTAGFLFSPWPMGALAWAPVLLYTAADVADYFDGYLARVTNHATRLGERLDMEFDGLGMVVVSVLAVWYGQLPWWYLILGSARYLFVLGTWWRQRLGKPIHALPPSVHRRVFAGFQMGFMSAVLWPIVPPAAATIAGTVFATATVLSFLRDWLVASGRLDPAAPVYRQAQRWLFVAVAQRLPPLLRLALLLAMVMIYQNIANWLQPPAWATLIASWSLPGAAVLATGLSLVDVLATGMVVVGALGRLAAFLLVFPIGFDMATRGLYWDNGLALTSVICLMLLSTGAFSLWRPEDKYLLRRAGESAKGEVGEAKDDKKPHTHDLHFTYD
ncbi:MAG TPA: CDP-alcohol phosphatidyltransferase family protein [Anaerolineae bacterium]